MKSWGRNSPECPIFDEVTDRCYAIVEDGPFPLPYDKDFHTECIYLSLCAVCSNVRENNAIIMNIFRRNFKNFLFFSLSCFCFVRVFGFSFHLLTLLCHLILQAKKNAVEEPVYCNVDIAQKIDKICFQRGPLRQHCLEKGRRMMEVLRSQTAQTIFARSHCDSCADNFLS